MLVTNQFDSFQQISVAVAEGFYKLRKVVLFPFKNPERKLKF